MIRHSTTGSDKRTGSGACGRGVLDSVGSRDSGARGLGRRAGAAGQAEDAKPNLIPTFYTYFDSKESALRAVILPLESELLGVGAAQYRGRRDD